jgi:iron complex transport system substrate-binding protein
MLKTKILTTLLLFLALLSCNQKTSKQEGRKITDMLNRIVEIPDSVTGIIGIRPGTVRLLAYMDAVHFLKGVEELEVRSYKPYNMAYSGLASLPVIGPMHGGDAELIAAQKPDVILSTYITVTETDELQAKTGIPVIALQYGDLGKNKTIFYHSLSLIGDITGNKKRADSVIAFFERIIEDLDSRTNQIPEKGKPTVYIGGVSNRGAHGIISTDPAYEPFNFINAKNIANMLSDKSHTVNIDIEQLIKWDPDMIFLDCAGLDIIGQEIHENRQVYNSLKAFCDSTVYLVQPHNWYTTNFATVLVNSYYIGKKVFPVQFSDIRPDQVAGSIYTSLLGKDISINMIGYYGGYSKYSKY